MKSPIRLVKYFITISALVIAIQVVSMPFANAVDNITPQGTSGDLSVVIYPVAAERAFAALICNNGTDDISSFTLDMQSTNYTIDNAITLPGGFATSNVADSGSYDKNSSVWNGTLKGSVSRALIPPTPDLPNPAGTPQCLAIGIVGTVTGNIGEVINVTVSIVSSTLGDSTPNVDPDNSNDSFTYTSAPIVHDPNLVLETRLLTTGPISDGTDISYELTIKNVGLGQYVLDNGNPLGAYFIVPVGATYVSITDPDTSDDLNINTPNCGSLGNVNGFLPAFTGYDAELSGCQFYTTSGTIEPGAEFKLHYNMTANGPFSNGDTKVMAILIGNDIDSIYLQLAIYNPSTDPLSIDNDNYVYLGFDGTQLAATVNRCVGTGEVVTSDDACFTITFNKQIYVPSFGADDLVVTNGEISSFSKTGENEWTVRIHNMAPGKTVSISISPNNDILDYSAVQAQTQVLGINTVRYEDGSGNTSGTATGTLANTGAKDSEKLFQISLILMIFGLAIKIASKRREIPTI